MVSESSERRRRRRSIVIGAALIIIAVTAVIIGRVASEGIREALVTLPGIGDPYGDNIGVSVLAGSEKLAFSEDREVIHAFAERGYWAWAEAAGSREVRGEH